MIALPEKKTIFPGFCVLIEFWTKIQISTTPRSLPTFSFSIRKVEEVWSPEESRRTPSQKELDS
jgi:hypothetical protein